jgi:hypothetical protein
MKQLYHRLFHLLQLRKQLLELSNLTKHHHHRLLRQELIEQLIVRHLRHRLQLLLQKQQ